MGGWLLLLIPLLHMSGLLLLWVPSYAQGKANLLLSAVSYSCVALGYARLLVLALGSRWVRGIFSIKPMRTLGKYSYGLYVLHLIILAYIEKPLRDWLQEMHVGKGFTIALIGLAGFGSSLLAAVLSYQLYERHFLRLKRFFDYRPHGPGATSAALQSSSSKSERPSTDPALHRS